MKTMIALTLDTELVQAARAVAAEKGLSAQRAPDRSTCCNRA